MLQTMDDLLTAADVERLRLERGLTIAQLCALAGVASTIFTRWKAGRYEPTMSNYRKLRDAIMSEPVATPLAIVASMPIKQPRRQRNRAA